MCKVSPAEICFFFGYIFKDKVAIHYTSKYCLVHVRKKKGEREKRLFLSI